MTLKTARKAEGLVRINPSLSLRTRPRRDAALTDCQLLRSGEWPRDLEKSFGAEQACSQLIRKPSCMRKQLAHCISSGYTIVESTMTASSAAMPSTYSFVTVEVDMCDFDVLTDQFVP